MLNIYNTLRIYKGVVTVASKNKIKGKVHFQVKQSLNKAFFFFKSQDIL